MRRLVGRAELLGCMALVGAGCASHHAKISSTIGAYTSGQYAQAETSATNLEGEYDADDNDRLLYLLEEGQILTMTGKAQHAHKVLSEAHDLTAPYLDEKSDVSVTEIAVSTLLNPTTSSYTGTSYDRIMLDTLQAMSSMQLGDAAAARVELNHAGRWQVDAKANNARRIEEAQDKLEEEGGSNGYDVAGAKENDAVSLALEKQYASLKDLRGYQGYVNPYTDHLSGVFRLTRGRAQDASRARDYFRQAAAVLSGPAKKAMLEDATRASRRAAGRTLAPSTYVYFFTGLAPMREEFKLRIPIPFTERDQNGQQHLRIIYVAAAFPTLKLRDDHLSGFTVDGASGKAVEIANLDSIVGQTFQDELPLVITQAIASAALKGAAQYGLAKELGGLGNLAGAVLTELTTSADLRTWETLPKQIHYLRVNTPADGKLTVKAGGRTLRTVAVEPRSDNVVWITIPSTAAQPAVAKAKL